MKNEGCGLESNQTPKKKIVIPGEMEIEPKCFFSVPKLNNKITVT